VGEETTATTSATSTTDLVSTNHEQTISSISTTGFADSSTGIGSVTTLNETPAMSTKSNQGTDDAQQRKNEVPISTILILSVVIALVSGIVVVIVCLVAGSCVYRRLHRKQRRLDFTSLNVPDGKLVSAPYIRQQANLKVQYNCKYCIVFGHSGS
jgi:beta-lactamase regulating signal transducer with metallopeptidase domain